MTRNNLFDEDDPFGLPPVAGKNAPPEYSVSELSHKLKTVVENEFSYVRVRGEISKVTVAKSGHLYTSLKDADAVLDAICWKGTVSRLSIKPEEGMEVVCTGRLTTYPGRSNYQLIIETMELAGQGALLKMLEDRRKKLASEGLFDAGRKRSLPFLPDIIGVITSPTGAVIRDILHRLDERFPRRVLLWPVMVQGQGAAAQVTAAINGFNALPANSPDRPDLLIVARGGGSLEDLMPFNDEALVRAAASSKIPLISAVGHETDTTLIDYAADLRAPTPTAAAEKAVPVRAELLALTRDTGRRMLTAVRRMLELPLQRLDHLSSKLDAGLKNWLQRRSAKLNELSAKLSPQALARQIADARRILSGYGERLLHTEQKILKDRTVKMQNLSSLLESLSFERVLERGYAVVFDGKGNIISSAKKTAAGEDIKIRFKDGESRATVEK